MSYYSLGQAKQKGLASSDIKTAISKQLNGMNKRWEDALDKVDFLWRNYTDITPFVLKIPKPIIESTYVEASHLLKELDSYQPWAKCTTLGVPYPLAIGGCYSSSEIGVKLQEALAWSEWYFSETGGKDPVLDKAVDSHDYVPVYATEDCKELAKQKYGYFGYAPGAPFMACHGKKLAIGLGILGVLWIARPLLQIGSDISGSLRGD